MINFTLSESASILNGHLVGDDAAFSAVSTDSRNLQSGQLFVALSGPNFDGHDYISQAEQSGAAGAMVQRELDTSLPCVQVADTLKGLGQLASAWRVRSGSRVAAVTGSNGKTTVKEMLAAILARKGSVLATKGNLNNEIGLPLTLLRIQDQEFAVVEMGANHPGEIATLSRIAAPEVALITNAGRAHLEGFGSVEGVARAKGEIVQGLSQDGTLVLNADDEYAGLWRELAGSRATLSFGFDPAADISASEQTLRSEWRPDGFYNCFRVKTPDSEFEVELGLAGRHNCTNALAAIAVASLMGATDEQICQGLAEIRPVAGRLCPQIGRDGIYLIDDSYNANPDSVSAAIDVLAATGQTSGRRFLVLGELAELGEGVDLVYRQLGELARAAGIEHLYAVGAAGAAASSFGAGGHGFQSNEQIIDRLSNELGSGDMVLVKGSRKAAMECVVHALSSGEGS
ncbi:MAG: UDP-N-acetylmuramoyl-tripeptide--D-alanyl-D-alanine ligase [Gammaproteobacteria bacterium]|nr:UDP-N-acetylmuramoyl-tripeptide--D-alanyl-D-alanine ligase [Gammaproteobacteria bacterium]